MNYEEIYDSSYERVLEQKEDRETFFNAFYERFIGSSKRVAEKFGSTDMEKQRVMLKKSFFHLLAFYASNQTDEYIDKIARAHDKHHHNIDPSMYDGWLDNLMATVAEFDPQFNEEVELAWRLVLTPGITYIKYKYNQPAPVSTQE
ncbi:MAG: globin [Agarilytica sp.]